MVYLIGYIVVCWLAADFVAGFFHWWEDQYAVESWPIIGTLVAGPNALHHADQAAFLKGSYWHRNWTTIAPAAIVGLPVTFLFPQSFLFFVFISQANEIHSWSHRRTNRIISVLQETGFLCSPLHHSKHHSSPFNIRYCVMSNWLNPFLDSVSFLSIIEHFTWVTIGVRPRSWSSIRQPEIVKQ
jgi:Lipid desaturase domain